MATAASTITITINDTVYTLEGNDPSLSPISTLSEFIRHKTTLRSVKNACQEGGCGNCTVQWEHYDSVQKKTVSSPINACLALMGSLNGTKVYTNEWLGDAVHGPSPSQKLLADNYGAQCGYCSNGFLMTMSSYLKEHPKPTEQEIEKLFDGNMCRCTGYRKILDTFHEIAKEARDGCLQEKCCQKRQSNNGIEIEDAACCAGEEVSPKPPSKLFQVVPRASDGSNILWQDVISISELAYWVNEYKGQDYMITVGGTSMSFWSGHSVFLNVSRIPEFGTIAQSADGLIMGAAVTIQQLSTFLKNCKAALPFQTSQYPEAAGLLDLVGGRSVRVRSSVVGNLMLCHDDPSFQSDVAMALLGLDAKITVMDATTKGTTLLTLQEFFACNFAGKFVVSVSIPWGTPNTTLRLYKVGTRQTNDHAIVNMAVRVTLQNQTTIAAAPPPIVAVGGVLKGPQRVGKLESEMVGVDVTSVDALRTLSESLSAVLKANVDPRGGRVAYRLAAPINFLYKAFLSLQPSLDPKLRLAALPRMERGISSGTSAYTTDAEEAPLSLPLPKLDGVQLTTGQAVFVDDMPVPAACTYGAVVLAAQANCELSYDANAAKDVIGFLAFYDHTSISDLANETIMYGTVFCKGHSDFAGQCIGLVVAESESIARHCVSLIQRTVQYQSKGKVVVTLEEAIKENTSFSPLICPWPIYRGDANKALAECTTVVTEQITIAPQYHMQFEGHTILIRKVEDQYVVHTCTQAASLCQFVLASQLLIPESRINVTATRCGGAFGGKAIASFETAFLASVAMRYQDRPFKLRLSLKESQSMCGGRPEYRFDCTMGLNENNQIHAMKVVVNVAGGPIFGYQFSDALLAVEVVENCYNVPNILIECKMFKTHTTPCQAVRGPGTNQASTFAEVIVSHLAAAAKKKVDPTALRLSNFYNTGDTMPNGKLVNKSTISALTTTLAAKAELDRRKGLVEEFNAKNKFVKRGITLTAMRFPAHWSPTNFNAVVAVFSDGSVSVTHGGVEVGQGINTKISQLVAFKFGMAKEGVPTVSVFNNTTQVCTTLLGITGGSVTTEIVSRCVIEACDTLLKRLHPFRKPGQSWAQLIAAATAAAVDLTATGYSHNPTFGDSPYNSWATAICEAEVDSLQGQFQVRRVDILFDSGVSMNPLIDIGQIQGGFMMGQGWFTQELVGWSDTTGAQTGTGTWNYKAPMSTDIPEVFNVSLMDKSTNLPGIMNSKALAEPCVTLASCVPLAIEEAVNAQRLSLGLDRWKLSKLPLPPDEICVACGVTPKHFVLS